MFSLPRELVKLSRDVVSLTLDVAFYFKEALLQLSLQLL
jgi:hypothetical protein